MLSSARAAGATATAVQAQAHFYLEDDALLKKIDEVPFDGADSFAEPVLRVPQNQRASEATQMIECIDKGSDSHELLAYNIEDVDRAGTSSEELGEYSSMLTLKQPKQQSPILSCSQDAKNMLS